MNKFLAALVGGALVLMVLLPTLASTTEEAEPREKNASNQTDAMTSIDLKEHRWKDRVILIFAAHEEVEDYQTMSRALADQSESVEERDLVIYHLLLDGESEAAAELEAELELDVEEFYIVLIGKDGGIKMQSDQALEPRAIFDRIDGMPMRQREIRQRQSR